MAGRAGHVRSTLRVRARPNVPPLQIPDDETLRSISRLHEDRPTMAQRDFDYLRHDRRPFPLSGLGCRKIHSEEDREGVVVGGHERSSEGIQRRRACADVAVYAAPNQPCQRCDSCCGWSRSSEKLTEFLGMVVVIVGTPSGSHCDSLA
jgi:hypothetical protein